MPVVRRGSLTQGGGVEYTRTVLRRVSGQERGQLWNVAVEQGRRRAHVRWCERTQLTPAFFILSWAPSAGLSCRDGSALLDVGTG